jgi:HPt (histidine-containing phosphotransfer) domain-containing protein
MKLPEDELVLELLPEFIDTWVEDVKTLYPKHLSEKNGDEMYRLAHTLKGSCYQFGLDDLGDMGIEIMGHVKSGDWDKVAEYEAPLVNKFTEIQKYLKDNDIT